MNFRLRIAAWVVLSCTILISVLMYTAHRQLEEELRQGAVDPNHPPRAGWTLHNSYSEEEIQDILGEIVEEWLWVAIPLVILSLGGGLLLARRSLRPVRDINSQISAMRPDSLHGGILIPESDPIFTDLVSHLNGLLDRAGTAYREMADFSSRVAHDLRTPLMLLRARVEHAPPGCPTDFQEEIQDEIDRLYRFVERSLIAAKAERGTLEATSTTVDLAVMMEELVADYRLLGAERGLDFVFQPSGTVPITADPDLLKQMLHGLLENALHYAASRVEIRCTHGGSRPPTLSIHNDLDPQSRPPSGLGLGLRMVNAICRTSGFAVNVAPGETDFRVTVQFPTAAG